MSDEPVGTYNSARLTAGTGRNRNGAPDTGATATVRPGRALARLGEDSSELQHRRETERKECEKLHEPSGAERCLRVSK